MKYLASFLFFLLLPHPTLSATPVPVQSGEHKNYTRLVIRILEGTVWQISTQNFRAEVAIEDPNIVLDLENVFSKIPRSRILSLSQTAAGNPLEVRLNCDCAVVGFVLDSIWLVIDIKDKPNNTNTVEFNASHSIQFPLRQSGLQYRFSTGREKKKDTIATKEDTVLGNEVKQDSSSLDLTNLSPESETRISETDNYVFEEPGANIPELSRLSDFERRLIAQLDRAQDQGLTNNRHAIMDNLVDHLPSSRNEDRSAEHSPQTTQLAAPLSNSNVQTSIDRDLGDVLKKSEDQEAPKCEGDSSLNLHSWAMNLPFDGQIGTLRSSLFGEFDSVDADASKRLAKMYLHFGFGAEARQVLLLGDKFDDEASMLVDLSYLVDNNVVSSKNRFFSQHACNSDASLWAILANPMDASRANHPAVLQAFSRLPEHLRLFFGPILSKTYSKHGLTTEADAVLRNIDRITEEPSSGMDFALGSVAAAKGEIESSELHRMSAIEEKNEYSAQALIDLIETALVSDSTVSPEIVDLSASYVTEFRHSDIGEKLRRAHVVALGMTGAFDSAFQNLELIGEFDGTGPRNDLQQILLDLLTQRASDVDFLKFSLSSTESAVDPLPDDLGNKLARRLLDLGFSRPAVRILSNSMENPASQDRRLLRAEAALGQKLPHEAMVALLGVEGAQADDLRAKALIQLERHEQAAEYLIALDATDEAARSLWIADAEHSSLALNGSQYSDIAMATEALLSPSPPQEGSAMLARARRLAEGSEVVRRDIVNLLEGLEVGE